ncbi:DNA internalization-related competence protein ComEC/Rec2 [Microbulbifer hainanensis]|uniref:DNA internalization-related competence protein ComEC/Rec2 n=1 Tax=Microbulbifer hainanensis TaxID=2735675 RepID=UPI001866FA79|nr:DNA internalization-related competence protein ComEC/Rec2 [Microbulbifer hainanensis]
MDTLQGTGNLYADTGQGARVCFAPGLPLPLLWIYALSVVLAGSLPHLPPLPPVGIAGVVICLVCLAAPGCRRLLPAVLVAVVGFNWGLWHNHQAMERRLPMSAYGQDFTLDVEVVSLPQVREEPGRSATTGTSASLRFTAQVLAGQDAESDGLDFAGELLDLTWYRAPADIQAQLRCGSRWRLALRLKRPRGSVNPHGFDYEGWLLRRGIYATGYVRPRDLPPRNLGAVPGLAALRQHLKDTLWAQHPRRPELLSALLLGDRSGLSRADRQLLQRTGTAHLLAISGLHVGLVAGCLLLLGGVLGRLWGIWRGCSPTYLPAALAVPGCFVYTLLAGAPLSAQRALVMVCVLLFAWRWRLAPGFAFALALAIVLTLQPLAFYSAGFWLSFVAVAALLLSFTNRVRIRAGADSPASMVLAGARARGADLLRSQWAIFLALLLPSLFFFSGFSAGGALVNLIAIPWVGLLILPSLLCGALLVTTPLGPPCLAFAGWQLDLLMDMLAKTQALHIAWQSEGLVLAIPGILCAAGSALLLLMPRGLPGRGLGWLFFAAVLLPWIRPAGEPAGLQVTALDVGQGLAVVVRTPEYQLAYDTGPRSATGWSAGSAVVAPYLLGEGSRDLDSVIVSHADLDHAGGLDGVMALLDVERIVAPGELAARYGHDFLRPTERCIGGGVENHGALQVRWLWPRSAAVSGAENDDSCVALLNWHGVRILLAGDISAAAERQIVHLYPDLPPVDLLVAPHHGSRSSSSPAFVRWAHPDYVVFSAGFRHHFGHPHAEIVARYRAAGAHLLNTAASGAVKIVWRPGQLSPVVNVARDSGPFWIRASNDLP